MQVKYQKSDLNIILKSEDQQLELLKRNSNKFVDLTIENLDETTIEIEYNLENLNIFSEYHKKADATKLRVGVSLIHFVKDSDPYFKYNMEEENIYVSYDLNIKLLKREFIDKNESEDHTLDRLKALIGSLFLNYSAEKIYGSGNTLLKKHDITKKLFDIQTIEELEEYLINKIEQIEIVEREKKVMVAKSYHLRNLILKIALCVIIVTLGSFVAYYTIIVIPNSQSQLDATSSYYKGSYEEVQDHLKETNINAMTPYTKYILSVSTINMQALSETQKENILINLSPQVEEGVLNFWVYIGQGKTKSAYDQSITNNDAQQKAFALALLIQETQNNTDLSEEEKQSLISTYQGELDQLNSVFEESEQNEASNE